VAIQAVRVTPLHANQSRKRSQLRVTWTFHTGALPHDPDLDKSRLRGNSGTGEGKLFFTTPYDHVFALNPQTGKKLWEFDPQLELPYGASEVTSRGVSAWRDPKQIPSNPALRIFFEHWTRV